MEINGKTYRNLESQVAYLTDVWNNQVALNEMGIKVVGHVDTEAKIPTGTYEYGDAYMVGTEVPYTMYVWTRADLSHSNDYWFNVGKFPLPGPKGDTGESVKLSLIDDSSGIIYANYNSTKGITANTPNASITYSDGTTEPVETLTTTPLIFNANDFTPVASVGKVALDLNHTKLATSYWKVIPNNSTIPYYWNGKQYAKATTTGAIADAVLLTDNRCAVKCNIMSGSDNSMVSAHNVVKSVRGNSYCLLSGIEYASEIGTNPNLHYVIKERDNPPMNILMTDEEVFNSTTYPNKQGILHLSNYQCPISGRHEYTYTTQIPGYYIVYKITDESNGQDTSSDLWSMNRSIYKMGTEIQPSEM